jgi:hypothetical protein
MSGHHQLPEDIDSSRTRRAHLPDIHIGRLTIEAHRNIASPMGSVRADAAGLWNRACPRAVAGVEVLALSPEDLLLHLCLHACYQHLLTRLSCFIDIAESVQCFGVRMDWVQFAARASAWGAARYVGLALHLARTMLGARVPDRALERLVPGGLDQRVFEAAKQSIFAQTGYGQWLPLFDREHVTGFSDGVKLAWTRVFLSRAEMAAMYPASRNSSCLYLYYARQVGRVVTLYTTHTLRRARLMMSRERDRNAALVNWLKED